MISIAEALDEYHRALRPMPQAWLELDAADGATLSRGLRSQLDLPPMDQSAMDGYAMRRTDLDGIDEHSLVSLPLQGTVAAGQPAPELQAGACLRVFTGAPVPAGADAVEIQEQVVRNDKHASFRHRPNAGANIRRRGEELRAGDEILPAGTRLTPQTLALAAMAGHARLPCHRPPRAAVLTTGDELVAPGRPLQIGQIYQSNSHFLLPFLRRQGCTTLPARQVPDDPAVLASAVAQALAQADLLILTGGASVGDHDYSRAALQACGVREVFWKVAQKPGKPLSFGITRAGQAVLVLPGNPASVFVCAQVHLRAVIARLAGREPDPPVPGIWRGPDLATDRRARLLRVEVGGTLQREFKPLPAQASHMLSNLARANALVWVPAEAGLRRGEIAQGWLLG